MNARRHAPIGNVEGIRGALRRLPRRVVLQQAVSLGGLALLGGCGLSTNSAVDAALRSVLRFDDKVQAALFSGRRLAKAFPESAVTHPFRFNAFYPKWQVRGVPEGWRLEVGGRIRDKTEWTLAELRAMPQVEQITRLFCIEGWSQIGHWRGIPLRTFLLRIGADLRAPFVSFRCFDGYSTSIDMASALHPQTILALEFDGRPLTPEWGAPVRLRIPTKLGFKSAKNLQAIEVTNVFPGGFWEDQGYDWFSGV
jgi:DMSO/TMAO reductase YedYZ molybdopterin-dependent catalytic subunit